MKRASYILFLSILLFPLALQAQNNELVTTLLANAIENNRKNDDRMFSLADSAENILINKGEYTDQFFEASYLKSRVMVRSGQDIEAISYLEKQLNLQQEVTEHVAQNYFILGLAYRHIGNQNKTIYNYNKAIQLFDSLNICEAFVKVKNNLGNYYNDISRFELALDNYKMALAKLELCPDNYVAAKLERNIGVVYFNYFKDLDKGEVYFKNAIESFSKLDTNNTRVLKSLIGARIYLAHLLTEKKAYNAALSIYHSAYLKAKNKDLIIQKIESLDGLANVYRLQNNLNQAEKNYLKAIALAEKKSYNYLLGNLYTGIAKSYIQKKQLKTSLNYLDQALEICEKNQYLQEKAEVLLLQANTLQSINKTNRAFQKLSEYSLLKDQIFNEDNNRKIKAKKSDIDLLKKDQEIKILQLEQERNKAIKNAITSELRSKNNLLLALAGILLLGIIIAITVVKNRNKKAKIIELELEKQKDKLKHSLLVNQKMEEIKLFKTAIESKKEEQERISRDLHDNIGATLAAIKLSLNNDQTDREEIIPFLDNVYNHVRDLSHNLASISKGQVNFEEIVRSYIEKLCKISNINIHFEVFPNKSLSNLTEQYQAELFSILREGLNNAIKHSQTKEMEVVITKEANWIHLYIEDHGNGFDIEQETEGIGLKNINSRVKTLGGKFEIDTHPERGVILNISIPYDN